MTKPLQQRSTLSHHLAHAWLCVENVGMKKLIATVLLSIAICVGSVGMSAAADFQKSLEAAQNGDALAQFNLGAMYAHGDSVAKNDREAVKWYRLAAEQGDPHAQNNLGLMYANGEGVEADYVKAIALMERSTRTFPHDSQYAGAPSTTLGWWYLTGKHAPGIPTDDALALYWNTRGAIAGHPNALANLALMFATGIGIKQDAGQSVLLLLKAMDTFDEGHKRESRQHLAMHWVLDEPDDWPLFERATPPEHLLKAKTLYRENVVDPDPKGIEALHALLISEPPKSIQWAESCELESGRYTSNGNWVANDGTVSAYGTRENAKACMALGTIPRKVFDRFLKGQRDRIEPKASFVLQHAKALPKATGSRDEVTQSWKMLLDGSQHQRREKIDVGTKARDLCDRLAEHPLDMNKKTEGVYWDEIDVDNALVACREAAKDEPNDPKLQFQLGRVLERAGSIEEAVSWYQKAAVQGYARAQQNLSRTREEYASALEQVRDLCDALAEHPSDENRETYGVIWDEIDVDNALFACRAAAEEEPTDPKVQFQLGRVLDRAGNTKEAVSWYQKAADQGYVQAQENLAGVREEYADESAADAQVKRTPAFSADLQKGLTAAQSGDFATALSEWKPLAEQGNAGAQYYLGVMYTNGNGVPQDHKTALKWYSLAAKQGDADAQYNLGVMYEHEHGHGVPQDYKTAVKWYRLSAEQGNARAQNNLGTMYKNGQGVPQDYKTAAKWYSLSAEQGNAIAQSNLGWMYFKGQGVPQDNKTAVKWFRLSAEQGNADAQLNLGAMYNDGQGVPQDYKTAVKWYRLAAEQGDARAQFNLGLMYGNGMGVIQNNVYAHMWLSIAASSGNSKNASYNRGITAGEMTPAQIAEAQKLARECVRKKYKGC